MVVVRFENQVFKRNYKTARIVFILISKIVKTIIQYQIKDDFFRTRVHILDLKADTMLFILFSGCCKKKLVELNAEEFSFITVPFLGSAVYHSREFSMSITNRYLTSFFISLSRASFTD